METKKEDWDLSYKDPEHKKILSSYHSYLKNNFGKAKHCESAICEKKSERYEWCLKTGRKYSKNPEDYLWLCRKCHRKYDLTPEKKEKAIKNLMWYGKQKQWSVYSKQCVDCKTTERKYKANGRCTKCYNKYALKKQKNELLYKNIKGKESINY